MTDEEDKFKLKKKLCLTTTIRGKLWTCLGRYCSKALIVFLSQKFAILLFNFACFCRTQFSKTSDGSTISVGYL